MQQSNTYIIIFTAIMTFVIGGSLSLTNQALKPAQTKSIELDTKIQILGAVMEISRDDDVLGIYDQKIEALVVDINGDEITTDEKGNPMVPAKVNVLKNFKKAPENRQYPVYKLKGEGGGVESYIFPVYGNGLWNNIYGYVALDGDLNTIRGVSFGHIAETPGLGQRIDTKEVQQRYQGKQVFDETGNLVSVTMVKGETGNPGDYGPHTVDGMSGATMTANGLNDMMADYMSYYKAYIEKVRDQQQI